MLPFGTYCRIETAAGGLQWATPYSLIRATRDRLHPDALGRDKRAARHALYRQVLAKFNASKAAARRFHL